VTPMAVQPNEDRKGDVFTKARPSSPRPPAIPRRASRKGIHSRSSWPRGKALMFLMVSPNRSAQEACGEIKVGTTSSGVAPVTGDKDEGDSGAADRPPVSTLKVPSDDEPVATSKVQLPPTQEPAQEGASEIERGRGAYRRRGRVGQRPPLAWLALCGARVDMAPADLRSQTGS
jgi:hypothetical protein